MLKALISRFTPASSNRQPLQLLLAVSRMEGIQTTRFSSSFLFQKAFVNGQWVAANSGKTFEVTNPSTLEVLGTVPDMDASDTQKAIEVAHKAFQTWRDVPAKERCAMLHQWKELCMQHKSELAKLLTSEMGKPLKDAEAELNFGATFFDWFGEEARRAYGDVVPSPARDKRLLVLRQPIGVCGMITPWNSPHVTITRKACAAIAAGCTVVLKPAEDTPYCALALCELSKQAGLPDGVFNVVTASRCNAPSIGKELCENPFVRKISFTGSTNTGKVLLRDSASTVKKMSLELGGNAPFIVFDSADVSAAVAGAMACKFKCSGQVCICANRMLVQEGIYDSFVKRLAEVMNSDLKVGDGFDPATTQGPLINRAAVDKVNDLVQNAVESGAKVVLGGKRHGQGGNFYQPTLLTEVTPTMRCATEEIFGPVASIIKFKTEEEALAIANATQFGLAGYFYTRDAAQIWRVSEKLEIGMVAVNDTLINPPEVPFGGVKESGLGREGGKYGLDEYMELKYVCMGGI